MQQLSGCFGYEASQVCVSVMLPAGVPEKEGLQNVDYELTCIIKFLSQATLGLQLQS